MKSILLLSRSTPVRIGLLASLAVLLGSCAVADRDVHIVPLPATETDVALRIARHSFPLLANQIQACCRGPRTVELFEQLHYWDLAVVDSETLVNLHGYFGPSGILRTRNPSMIVVAYVSAADTLPSYPRSRSTREEFRRGLDSSWYLRDIDGKEVLLFEAEPGRWTLALNLTTPVNEYIPRFMNDRLLSTGLVDGIFFDWAMTDVSWLNRVEPPRHGPLDIDNDGRADPDRKLDRLWQEGFERMLENSRRLLPAQTLLVGNGGWNSNGSYAPYLNGIMIEQFLEGEPVDPEIFGWGAVMRTYSRYQVLARTPRMSLIMANGDDPEDFDRVRFALASTLMFDGYFCFTNRSQPGPAYTSAFWFDEYAVDLESGRAGRELAWKGYLGEPSSAAFATNDRRTLLASELADSPRIAGQIVWRRDFANGIVLVNPSSRQQSVDLGGTFRKIRGTMDPEFNDGSEVRSLTMAARTGVVLLRPPQAEKHISLQSSKDSH